MNNIEINIKSSPFLCKNLYQKKDLFNQLKYFKAPLDESEKNDYNLYMITNINIYKNQISINMNY